MFESDFLTLSAQSADAYRKLVEESAKIVCESLPGVPYRGASARELADSISADLLPDQGAAWDQITATLRTVVTNSVAVSHPLTAAHLHCPPLLASLVAEVAISALNQSMDSFDQAPTASVVEQKMVRWLCHEAGLPATADGTFTTGGSQSNYMGLLLARDAFLKSQWNWSAQKSGLPPQAGRLRILCSEVAHFSVEKSASQLGLGTDGVVRVEADEHFRMKPESLRDCLESLQQQGLLPMAIVATAGTTDFGSVDPLPDIARLARQSDAWMHVDAAYGGALLFSDRYRERLAGIEAADSISIDFHKLLWQPIPCSASLLRDARHFDAIKLYADYLNPEAHEQEGIPNLVTTSLLTSRRFDALKLWISFQALGRGKLEAMIEQTISLANYTAEVVRQAVDLELVSEPQLSTVVFRYLPVDSGPDADRINAQIPQSLFNSGIAVIGHTRVRGRQCLKLTCMNPIATEEDMKRLIELIRSEGQRCSQVKSDC